MRLPEPPAEAAAHSARVFSRIAADIAERGGAIGFDRFMELALYAPGLGYYAGGAQKFGEAGDFVTAPEMTPLFGQTLARFVAPVLARLGASDILEVGAGSGALAVAMLDALHDGGALPARYRILEPSPDLQARQRERLLARGARGGVELCWQSDLPAPGFRGVVVANEVLDAIPVRRFRIASGGRVEEQQVMLEKNCLRLCYAKPADDWLAARVRKIEQVVGQRLPEGYVSEVAPAREAWLGTLAERLAAGVVLLIDYGYSAAEYFHPQRVEGTLACHYRHRRHEAPLAWPGLCDITAHVDFSAQAESAQAAGLALAGFTTQAHFLLGNGLLELCAELEPGTPGYVRAAGLVQRLTMPQEMGEAVRVMALTRGLPPAPLSGFDTADLRSRL